MCKCGYCNACQGIVLKTYPSFTVILMKGGCETEAKVVYLSDTSHPHTLDGCKSKYKSNNPLWLNGLTWDNGTRLLKANDVLRVYQIAETDSNE